MHLTPWQLRTSNANRDPGFSLVELLVALVVGALLAHALLSAQHYSLYLATQQQGTWDSLNLSQELLAAKGLEELSRRPTDTWIAFPGPNQGQWRSTQSENPEQDCRWTDLETDVQGAILEWSWLNCK
ncbi:MAG: prepilin-type N-terminal cleavage/methylation domain-containing protein [Desulfovermiculus sp.]|nr:prepilin-type N-terminal cleavage/methylation domain-containing protein [Desulfovermiculus sp.]